ncbi:RNA-2',3'-PO4:RNA-5'-OH ligase [hydrothermal vent metagenome]|uniref:3'-phosphate/5'-hydroxy nucleic acid ligase n=1 Tax=hydrothermal vent metagenome TaxID=652676 RepID=A0A3B1CIA2_9ZZZZ
MVKATIFADNIEPDVLAQFNSAIEQDYSVKAALMPDAHLGYTLPIGAVVATEGVVVPSWVGYDIGCGMLAMKTDMGKEEIIPFREKIFESVYRAVPTRFHHNKRDSEWDYSSVPMTPELKKIFAKSGLKQIGSLGSGNHFIEISHDEKGSVWVVIHSGSRNVGHSVAARYMKLASGGKQAREGHFGLKVNTGQGEDYIVDMKFCLEFALENRKQLLDRVLREIYYYVRNGDEPQKLELINRTHNHAELKDGLWIHRKGATHAEKGMKGVIPGNMRDGSFIVVGKGNPDSLNSSSHGAGRAMSRTKAKKALNMEDFKKQMEGVTSKVTGSTLDEAPDAYKDIFGIMKLQKDLVDITHHLKPMINVKG